MPDKREQLIELLYADVCKYDCCDDCEYQGSSDACYAEVIAQTVDRLIANGVTVQNWIPRNEPPKKNGRYLCRYIFNEHYDMPFEQVLSYFATDKEPHFANEGVRDGMKVTHWMPLPEPPKGD